MIPIGPRTGSFRLLATAALCVMAAWLPPSSCPAGALPDTTLLYVSDYVSFVGSDARGHVAFALDTNRGRDGTTYQAEHFVVLHDEHHGWIDVDGGGFYPNAEQALARIPDSDAFQFQGTPETGLTVTSLRNQLTLAIEPLSERSRRTHDHAVTWMGSARAVLTWGGRIIRGRVIYEHLMIPGFNRLTRTYWGLYLLAGADGDVYLHSQQSERMAALAGHLVGFAVLDNETETLENLRVEVPNREFAFGFYRWPSSWSITWVGPAGPAALTVSATERKTIGGWVIGGFAMSIVRSKLHYAGRTIPVYSLAELLL